MSNEVAALYVEDFLDASWGGGVAKFRLVRLRPAGELEGHAAYVEVVAILAMSAANLAGCTSLYWSNHRADEGNWRIHGR